MARHIKNTYLSPLPNKKRVEKGAILFLAVGAISILSILTLGATSSVMQELRLSKFLTDSNTASFTVHSSIPVIKKLLDTDDTPKAVTIYDLKKKEITLGKRVIEAEFYDEQARINIDRASEATVARLPGVGIDDELVKRITQNNFRIKEELLWLEGMTPESYAGIKEDITVFGAGSVNVNTASKSILYMATGDEDLSDKIVRYRMGNDAEEGTEDDGVFSYTAEIATLLEPYGLSPEQVALINTLITSNILGVTSEYIGCNLKLTQNKKKVRTFNVVLNLTSGKIVSWQEM
ncbi:MAG TPA: type II secretion system protein GspK [Candidatus Omnitrophota bacterium]|nr:type II secretion system protein GspK [Candidatus Omnitrophota bacterium]